MSDYEYTVPELIKDLEAYQQLPIELQDRVSLDPPELAWVIEGLRLLARKVFRGQMRGGDRVAILEDGSTFDDISQLANVAAPLVVAKDTLHLRR